MSRWWIWVVWCPLLDYACVPVMDKEANKAALFLIVCSNVIVFEFSKHFSSFRRHELDWSVLTSNKQLLKLSISNQAQHPGSRAYHFFVFPHGPWQLLDSLFFVDLSKCTSQRLECFLLFSLFGAFNFHCLLLTTILLYFGRKWDPCKSC